MTATRSQVIKVANIEVLNILHNKITVLITLILLLLAIINIMGFSVMLSRITSMDYKEIFFQNISNFTFIMSLILAVFSMCIGVTSMAEEKASGTLNLLFTKPLLRKNVIAGKFIGINLFCLVYIVLTLLVYLLFLVLYSGFPDPIPDVIYRIGTLAILMFLSCALTLSVIISIAVIFKDITLSLISSTFFIITQWLTWLPIAHFVLDKFEFMNPSTLYLMTILKEPLFDTSVNYSIWLQNSGPYIILMLLEIVALMLLGYIFFNRDD